MATETSTMGIASLTIFLWWIMSATAKFSPPDIQTVIAEEAKYCSHYSCDGIKSSPTEVNQIKANVKTIQTEDLRCVTCEFQCRCDNRCDEFGDCCTNETKLSVPSNTDYECVSLEIKTKAEKVTYFMKTGCPRETSVSDDTVWKCKHPNGRDPRTTLPVKSKYENAEWVTYRNQYCAQCNGVALEDMTSWNIFIDCSQFLPTSFSKLESFDDVIAFVSNNSACHLPMMPIDDIPERTCKIYPTNAISSCNVTGKWRAYDARVEKFCLGYFAPVYVEILAFSNIFCAICNIAVTREAQPESCYKPVVPGARKILPPLSMLINFNPAQEAEPEVEETLINETICNCTEGEIYDHQNDTCRELFCTESLHLAGTDCTSIVGNSMGLTFSLDFILTSESKVHIDDSQYKTVSDSLTQILYRKLTHRVTFLRTNLLFRYNETDNSLLNIGVKMYMICDDAVVYKTFSAAALEAINSDWVFEIETHTYRFNGMVNPVIERTSETSSSLFVRHAMFSIHTRQYVTIHEIPNDETRMYAYSGTFLILRVSALYNCSQVRHDDNEYNDQGLSKYWLNVSGNVIGAGQYERFSDGTLRTCSRLIQTDNIRGCRNVTSVNSTLSDKMTSDALSIQGLVTLLAISISLLCLILTLITYLIFKELRTLPGKNNMLLILTLIIAQVVYLLGAIDAHGSVTCKIIGVLLHYFWLASFFWMNVCSLHVFLIFRDVLRSRRIGAFKRLCLYSIYAFSMPGLIVTLTIICFHVISGGKTIGYGQTSCYLSNPLSIGLAFALPLGLIIISNLIFFISTLRELRDAPKIKSNQENRQSSVVYIRLSSLTGVTWILGFVAAWLQEEVVWYLFIIFCGGQGVYIFVAFVCNKRILKLYRELLCDKKSPGKKRKFMYHRRQPEEFDYSGKRSTSDTLGDSYSSNRTNETNFSSQGH